ncbi:MAG: putative mucin/carbohydrate-binding domain-containing protein, partial [Sarcina sp.]
FYGLGDYLIATLGFDVTTKNLVVKSTGSGAHSYFGNNVYFSATLYDNNGQSLATSSVTGNENAGNFATILNGKSFSYGYYIKLTHAEPSRLSLSGSVINSPSTSSPFSFKNINLSKVTLYIRNNGIEYNFV